MGRQVRAVVHQALLEGKERQTQYCEQPQEQRLEQRPGQAGRVARLG